MFIIDTSSNKEFYIILRNNKEFVKVSRSYKLATIKKYFKITKEV